MAFAEDMAEFFDDDDFAESVNITRPAALDLPLVSAIISKDVDVVSDNGLSIQKRTIIDLQKSQVDEITEGDTLEIISTGECFTLMETLADDGVVLQVYARQIVAV